MNIDQAKQIQITDLLARLSHYPKKIMGNDAWYLSPLRDEKTASFKVNLKNNIWYDHGEGVGGNIVELAKKLQNTDTSGALKYLESSTGLITVRCQLPKLSARPEIESFTEILGSKRISNYNLKRYLQNERGIPLEIGYQFLEEVSFKLGGKDGYALGFRNRSGGWELRNEHYKGGIGKKHITVYETESNKIHAFEGWPDFLSAAHMDKDILKDNIVVLNSTSLKNGAINYIKERDISQVFTYFDNDKTGEKATEAFKQELTVVKPMNYLYPNFNDLNDRLTSKQLQR